ncbi:MAG: zf-HC2 domain-containing protein [Actinobacteria bacterium]|nr:zf-HC2 domain-containing protein [Actinomycetota bacterium]
METGERLSAYLAGELDADERAAVEADLARDPALRDTVERIRRAERALNSMGEVTPPPGFADHLREVVAAEVARQRTHGDELAAARRRHAPWRTLGVAAAAASLIVVVGVGAGWLLRGGADRAPEQAAPVGEGHPALDVPVIETRNDYSDLELQRLAVNVDIRAVIPPGLGADEAAAYADRLQAQLTGVEGQQAAQSMSAENHADTAAEKERQGIGDQVPHAGAQQAVPVPADDPLRQRVGAAADDVRRCLPEILQSARTPVVPVYIEVARYRGEPAIVYAFAAEDPNAATYRRVEAWAVARSDCQVLSFSQYDRAG